MFYKKKQWKYQRFFLPSHQRFQGRVSINPFVTFRLKGHGDCNSGVLFCLQISVGCWNLSTGCTELRVLQTRSVGEIAEIPAHGENNNPLHLLMNKFTL